MHYDVREDTELAWVSFQYFRNWKEMVGGDCGFTRTGFMQLVAPADAETLKGERGHASGDRRARDPDRGR